MVTSKISDFPEILLREIYPHYYLHMLPQGLVVYYNTSNSSNSSDNDATTATDDHLEELQTFHLLKYDFQGDTPCHMHSTAATSAQFLL